jgi:hypothetical protein
MNGSKERLCRRGGREKVSVIKDEWMEGWKRIQWMLKSRFSGNSYALDNKVEIAPEPGPIFLVSCDAEYEVRRRWYTGIGTYLTLGKT